MPDPQEDLVMAEEGFKKGVAPPLACHAAARSRGSTGSASLGKEIGAKLKDASARDHQAGVSGECCSPPPSPKWKTLAVGPGVHH